SRLGGPAGSGAPPLRLSAATAADGIGPSRLFCFLQAFFNKANSNPHALLLEQFSLHFHPSFHADSVRKLSCHDSQKYQSANETIWRTFQHVSDDKKENASFNNGRANNHSRCIEPKKLHHIARSEADRKSVV